MLPPGVGFSSGASTTWFSWTPFTDVSELLVSEPSPQAVAIRPSEPATSIGTASRRSTRRRGARWFVLVGASGATARPPADPCDT